MTPVPPPPCRAARERAWRREIDGLDDAHLLLVARSMLAVDKAVDAYRKAQNEHGRLLPRFVRPA
jgi:hypothetical protein